MPKRFTYRDYRFFGLSRIEALRAVYSNVWLVALGIVAAGAVIDVCLLRLVGQLWS
jgi:Co/Zn/Cd efflux system component